MHWYIRLSVRFFFNRYPKAIQVMCFANLISEDFLHSFTLSQFVNQFV